MFGGTWCEIGGSACPLQPSLHLTTTPYAATVPGLRPRFFGAGVGTGSGSDTGVTGAGSSAIGAVGCDTALYQLSECTL